MRLHPQIESLESRIAPAAVVSVDPIKLIAMIDADPGGDNLSIVQGVDGLIDILDNANGGASLTPSGAPEQIRGIIYRGGAGDDVTVTQLQNGIVGVAGGIDEASLPEGFVITDEGGTNSHTIEAAADFFTIGKKFTFTGSSGDDTLNINGAARQKDFIFTGGDGIDTLDLQNSTIVGKVALNALEVMTSGNNRQLGAVTINNAKNVGAPAAIAVAADLISGAVKYTGSLDNDSLSVTGVVNGAITMTGKDGNDSLEVTGTALKAITFIGGLGDDALTITGTVLGAITGNMGAGGANTVDIIASMLGKAITLKGGSGIDTFNVTAWNAGVLTATLGADQDAITTTGVFKSLKLDGGLDSAVHSGAEKTVGKVTRKNFI